MKPSVPGQKAVIKLFQSVNRFDGEFHEQKTCQMFSDFFLFSLSLVVPVCTKITP